jgi:dienelactone hydrolase
MVAPWASHAERVQLSMRPNLDALAEYRAGDPAKPAVLLLHGFLQTHEFPIVHHMTDGLADKGFTVLAPTLTLGVTHRHTSLACEAIHTHTLEDGMAEIDRWVAWLAKRHKGPIILIGHSLGSITLLAYMQRGAPPPVRHFIGVSIMEGRIEGRKGGNEAVLADLRQRIKLGKGTPMKVPYSFCKSFNAVPGSLFSYLAWTPDRIMATSTRLRADITYIMGSRDDRLGPGWIDALRRTGVVVKIIQGANHFMDGEHEFDLLDNLVLELNNLNKP